jgi:hypothetical protein
MAISTPAFPGASPSFKGLALFCVESLCGCIEFVPIAKAAGASAVVSSVSLFPSVPLFCALRCNHEASQLPGKPSTLHSESTASKALSTSRSPSVSRWEPKLLELPWRRKVAQSASHIDQLITQSRKT